MQSVLKDGAGLRRTRGSSGEKAAQVSGGNPQRPEVRGARRLSCVLL